MSSKTTFLTLTIAVLLSMGVLAGCGGDDEDQPSTNTGTTVPFETTTGPETNAGGAAGSEEPGEKGNEPASARDGRDEAPDDAISGRPGGPQQTPPVNPSPVK